MIEKHNSRKRFLGEFYTPLHFAKKAYEYIEDILGKDFFSNGAYRMWDMSCGTGNLESVIDRKFHKYLYMSTLREEDVLCCQNLYPDATVFQYDYLNDDLDRVIKKTDNGIKMPACLLRDLEDENINWLIFINPPFATSQTAGANSNSKKNVSQTKTRLLMHSENLGEVSRELYAQFLYRISLEFGHKTTLSIFSKTNYINSGNCEKMRKSFFNPKFQKGFMFSSSAFEGTSKDASFSVGMLIWDFRERKDISSQNITLDILDSEANKTAEKNIGIVDRKKFLNNWIERRKGNSVMPPLSSAIKIKTYGKDIRDKVCEGFIGSLMSCGNDVIKRGFTAILSSPQACAGAMSITKDNFEKAIVIHAVRRCVDVNWENSADQFMRPNKELSAQFINDCAAFTLFASSNHTASLRNVCYKNKIYQIENNFFPFSLDEIKKYNITDLRVKKSLEKEFDRFVAVWISEKTFSHDVNILFETGRKIYKAFYENLYKLDLEKYGIEYFDAGWWQIRKAMGEKNIESDLFNEIKEKRRALREKIKSDVYEYGFLSLR